MLQGTTDEASSHLARDLERQGRYDAAFEQYLRNGEVISAARVLATGKRYTDAGRLLITAYRLDSLDISCLDPERKGVALKAAIYLARGGEVALAVSLFVALGEKSRAISLLEKCGDREALARLLNDDVPRPDQLLHGQAKGSDLTVAKVRELEQKQDLEGAARGYLELKRPAEAARLLVRLGKQEEAARCFAEAGLPFEAAAAYLEGGNQKSCLEQLVKVSHDDARYRVACCHAVRLAKRLKMLDYPIEHLLGPFLRSGPRSVQEVEIFYTIGDLYEEHGFAELALEAFRKIHAVKPGFRDVAARQLRLETSLLPPPAKETRIEPRWVKHNTFVVPSNPNVFAAPTHVQLQGKFERPTVKLSTGSGGHPFVPGATIAGRYRIEQQIGKGGMAIVFKATDIELGEPIALKIFSQPIEDDQAVARLRLELRLARRISNPNVIRIYDIGIFEQRRYISMEYLIGEPLQVRLQRPLELKEGIHYLIQGCLGLQAAHDQSVIHRDIKPENFFILKDGTLKLIDFGLAKQLATSGPTVVGMIGGTPEYMSPEQIDDFSAVTATTDQYSLGVVAYQMFCGKVPFSHEKLTTLLMMHMGQQPTPPRIVNPHIPPELDALILRLLAKRPQDRFDTCRTVAQSLEKIKQRLK